MRYPDKGSAPYRLAELMADKGEIIAADAVELLTPRYSPNSARSSLRKMIVDGQATERIEDGVTYFTLVPIMKKYIETNGEVREQVVILITPPPTTRNVFGKSLDLQSYFRDMTKNIRPDGMTERLGYISSGTACDPKFRSAA